MKKLRILFLTLVILLMTTNVIVAEETATISFDSDGNITYNIPVNISFEDLVDFDQYTTMVCINDDESTLMPISSLLTIDDFFDYHFNNHISIVIKIFDSNTTSNPYNLSSVPEHGTFIIPTFYLERPKDSKYSFELDTQEIIKTVEITGNEVNTKLVLENDEISTLFSQEGNTVYIGKDVFKEFSINYDTYDISFINETGNIVKTITKIKLTSDVFKESLVNKNFSISNDSDNIYVDIDDLEFVNNITYIHVYGVDNYGRNNGYEIDKHIGYGSDTLAYDLSNEKSLMSLIDIQNQNPLLPISSHLSIPIPDFYDEYDKIAVDIYSDGYVTYHKFYEVNMPSPPVPPSPNNNEEVEPENEPIEEISPYKAPNTSVSYK